MSQHSQHSFTDSQQNSQSLFNSQQSSSQQSTSKSPIPISQSVVVPVASTSSQEISKIPMPKILNQNQHQDTPPIAKRGAVRIGLLKCHTLIMRAYFIHPIKDLEILPLNNLLKSKTGNETSCLRFSL